AREHAHRARGQRRHCRRRHGGCAAQRGRRFGASAGDRRADERGLRGEFWRRGGAAGHAQQLRQRRDRGEHRQRLRRRLRRQSNQRPRQRL
ncbi:uncharacterized protein METZ01_LOCUS264285, partial [marine metagenome]